VCAHFLSCRFRGARASPPRALLLRCSHRNQAASEQPLLPPPPPPVLCPQIEDEATIAKFPSFCHPNIWPTEDDCPGFVPACKAAAGLIVSVGAELARHCDAYVRHVDPTYGEHALAEVRRRHKRAIALRCPLRLTVPIILL